MCPQSHGQRDESTSFKQCQLVGQSKICAEERSDKFY